MWTMKIIFMQSYVYLILLKNSLKINLLRHVHWTTLNHNLSPTVVFLFHSLMGLTVKKEISFSTRQSICVKYNIKIKFLNRFLREW